MLYCNQCASTRKYPIRDVKVKGNCEICHAWVGPCNKTSADELNLNNISKEHFELAGFTMKQLQRVPINPRVDMVDPGSPHRIISENKVIFFREKSVVLANTKTGERVEIQY